MLRLTTTEAYSLVCEAILQTKDKHLPIVDEIGIFKNEAGAWSGYIHGKAEQLAGFDIPEFISGTLPAYMGEIPAILVLPDKEVECWIIQWPVEHSVWKYRALIVAKDDLEGYNYAIRCFNERIIDL